MKLKAHKNRLVNFIRRITANVLIQRTLTSARVVARRINFWVNASRFNQASPLHRILRKRSIMDVRLV